MVIMEVGWEKGGIGKRWRVDKREKEEEGGRGRMYKGKRKGKVG